MTSIKNLTIISITYNNEEELLRTYHSLKSFRHSQGTHIIINGGEPLKSTLTNVIICEEPDLGIYDAINKGISKVVTPYFMLIHSGDIFISTVDTLNSQVALLENENYDILLNNCVIELRKGLRHMKADNWKPWMLAFGAQPPHPPTIYKTKFAKKFRYDLTLPIISDFKYFEEIFQNNIKWSSGNSRLIHMTRGGKTSSGIKSFVRVSFEFFKLKGIKAVFLLVSRPLLKIYMFF